MRSQTQAVQYLLEAFGIWPLVRGDGDMHTNSRDRVPVYCQTRLFHTDTEVLLDVNQVRAQAGVITARDTAGFPVTISEPGSYRLTSNLDVRGQPDPENVTAVDGGLAECREEPQEVTP